MMQNKDLSNIYQQYVDDLYNYAICLGFEKSTVLDAIHDVFYKLSSERTMINNISNIKFYLFRSLKNRLLDIYKSKKQYIELAEIDEANSMPFHIKVSIEDALIQSEDQVRIKEQIEVMLNSLSNRQREIVYLRYIHEYDYEQISEILGISVHGCRKLVSKAMLILRKKYALPAMMLFLF